MKRKAIEETVGRYSIIVVHGRKHVLTAANSRKSFNPNVADKNKAKAFDDKPQKRNAEVIESVNNETIVEDANYKGTGMALCGIVKEGENLSQWIAKYGK